MATVLDSLITPALQELGTLDAAETPLAADSALALRVLNDLVDQYAAERLMIYTVTRTTWTIASGTSTYSVATGQTINRARPDYVDHINFQDTSQDPDMEYGMQELTDDAYSNIVQKAITSTFPSYWYYNPTYPNGTVFLWPVPTSSTLEGVMYAPAAVTEFASISTDVSLPPAYRRMLRTNLALELAHFFPERGIPQHLPQAAAESKSAVMRANMRPREMSIEVGALGNQGRFAWNIWAGP